MLFFPVSKLIWVLAVRRFEKKQKRKTTKEEQAKLYRRSRLVSAFIVVTFSFLFNRFIFHP